jgi:hypothetical protein
MKIVDECHADIGVALAEKWQLPDAIAEVIGQEHDPAVPSGAISSWLGYGHLLAEARGFAGGIAPSPDLEQRLIAARTARAGTVEREEAATEALLESFGARQGTSRALNSARRL